MVDRTVRDFAGDAKRAYLTGLSYGHFTWMRVDAGSDLYSWFPAQSH